MSVVKINAITVPAERADELVERFANRAGEVSKMPGFEAFELLRPTDDRDVFLVYTRWRSQEDFEQLAEQPGVPAGPRRPRQGRARSSTGSELLVVRRRAARRGSRRRVTERRSLRRRDRTRSRSRSSPGPAARSRSSLEDVLGITMQVYKQRMRTLRELMAQNAARADVDLVVQGDDPAIA